MSAKRLSSITIEGVKIESHTMMDKKSNQLAFGYMLTFSQKKKVFMDAERLSKLQSGLRQSADKLSAMLLENVEHTKKGYEVVFGEANPPAGVGAEPKPAQHRNQDGDLDFSSILSGVMQSPTADPPKSTEDTRMSTTKPVDTYDVFDALNVGF